MYTPCLKKNGPPTIKIVQNKFKKGSHQIHSPFGATLSLANLTRLSEFWLICLFEKPGPLREFFRTRKDVGEEVAKLWENQCVGH